MQRLPQWALWYDPELKQWVPSLMIGEQRDLAHKHLYAVPITKQEEAPTLHEPITREALNKALRERDEARAEARKSLRDKFAMAEQITAEDAGNWELLESLAGPRPTGNWTTNPLLWLAWECAYRAKIKYARADAMLAARNNQPGKV